MVRQVKLEIPEYSRITLTEMRNHHPKPYMRERAAVLLKVADGGQLKAIAREGLLRPRDPDTLGRWVKRYQAQGLAGLYNQPGRGRKPAFFPLSSG
jgi:transposase